MKEFHGELFDAKDPNIVITTNGYVKPSTGELVMGRGCAKQAKDRWPKLPAVLGAKVKACGNRVYVICKPEIEHNAYMTDQKLLSFPVKHNWWEKADLKLIEQSCIDLARIIPANETCALPRPGCGNGHLDWADVKPILEKYLDDRFTVYHKGA